MKLEIGNLYNVSRPIISRPIYLSSNIEFIADHKAKQVLSDQTIMLLSDKIELPWNGHTYKILTETGDVGYIYESNNVKLVFTAIS
jgi:hypothetical protein